MHRVKAPNTHRRKTKKKGLNVSIQYTVLFVANKLHRCAEAIKAPTHKTHTKINRQIDKTDNRHPTPEAENESGKEEKKKTDDQVESG